MRARALVALVSMFALLAGCASTSGQGEMPKRTAVRAVLVAVALGTAALAVGAAIKGNQVEKDLKTELDKGVLNGRDFAAKDDTGERWNRIARASTVFSALAVIGLGITWEMGLGDHIRHTPTKEGPSQPLAPPPGRVARGAREERPVPVWSGSAAASAPSTRRPLQGFTPTTSPTPAAVFHRSATAR
jgi:hypothetical protein